MIPKVFFVLKAIDNQKSLLRGIRKKRSRKIHVKKPHYYWHQVATDTLMRDSSICKLLFHSFGVKVNKFYLIWTHDFLICGSNFTIFTIHNKLFLRSLPWIGLLPGVQNKTRAGIIELNNMLALNSQWVVPSTIRISLANNKVMDNSTRDVSLNTMVYLSFFLTRRSLECPHFFLRQLVALGGRRA